MATDDALTENIEAEDSAKEAKRRSAREWRRRNLDKVREIARRWREKPGNAEKIRAYHREYERTHKEAIKASRERWLQKPGNAERLREYRKKYRIEHKERLAAIRKKWLDEKGADWYREYQRAYRKANPERVNGYKKRWLEKPENRAKQLAWIAAWERRKNEQLRAERKRIAELCAR